MRRDVYTPDHTAFRDSVRKFLDLEVVPHFAQWERDGQVSRDLYHKLGELGVLGIEVPEEYGGAGIDSYKFQAIVIEEAARAGVSLGTLGIHVGVVLPYVKSLGSQEQKRRWLPGMASGETWTAVGMTEPGTGSDLAGIRTSAVRDGDTWVINGQKTFITGGVLADMVLLVCRTSPVSTSDRRGGLSLIMVEKERAGFTVGRRLEKIGMRSSDTAELAFQDVRVPLDNLVGEEGRAFAYLTHNLPQERLSIGISATAAAAKAVDLARDYVRERNVFGQAVAEFQNTKFVLAECSTELEAAQIMVDRALELHEEGALTPADAARLKLYCTEMAGRVIDKCFQLHGGYGYMLEYPIARLYADIRVNRVYGGTSEIMKTIIAKDLGL